MRLIVRVRLKARAIRSRCCIIQGSFNCDFVRVDKHCCPRSPTIFILGFAADAAQLSLAPNPSLDCYSIWVYIYPGSPRIRLRPKMLPVRTRICSYCCSMVMESAAQLTVLPHWPSIQSLQESSRSCACCHILLGCAQERAANAASRFTQFEVDQMYTFPLEVTATGSRSPTLAAWKCRSTHIKVTLYLPNEFMYPFELDIHALDTTCCTSRALA